MNKMKPLSAQPARQTAVLGIALSLSLVALLAGCASSSPPPTEQLAFANAAVAEARSAGAPETAAVEMRTAQDKLDRANQAMGAKEYDRARALAEEAEVDAKLAAAKTRSAKAERAVAELREGIRTLQDEINRKTQ